MVPLLAGSDFHPNKQDEKPDYAPGTYQRILLSGAAKDPVQILAALRQGRTAVDQNLTIDRIAVECERQFDDYVNISINYTGFRMVQKLELIVGTGTAVEVKGLKEDLQPGSQTVEFSLDIPGITYVRVRGKSSGPCCVEGDKNRIAAFISSAVFCSNK